MASYKVGSLRAGLVRLRTGMNRSSATNFFNGQPGGLTRAVGVFGRPSGFSQSSPSFAHRGEGESSWLRGGGGLRKPAELELGFVGYMGDAAEFGKGQRRQA